MSEHLHTREEQSPLDILIFDSDEERQEAEPLEQYFKDALAVYAVAPDGSVSEVTRSNRIRYADIERMEPTEEGFYLYIKALDS